MKKKNVLLLMSIFVFSGVFGFIYEELFYRIDLGYFVKRGTTFGPWIPIYAFGGIFIYLLTSKFKDKPYLVFIISSLISGVLEFTTGYILLHTFNIRLWDYNVEILNYGNLYGFVCLRSILFFGVSSIFLIYVVVPILKKFKNKYTILPLFTLFILDIIISNLLKML